MQMIRKAKIAAVQAAELDVVVVECIAQDGSHYMPERDWNRVDWKSTARDIACGQIERVHAVYAFGRDIPSTEDMARDVLGIVLDDYEEIPGPQRDFLETALGCRVVADALRQRAA